MTPVLEVNLDAMVLFGAILDSNKDKIYQDTWSKIVRLTNWPAAS